MFQNIAQIEKKEVSLLMIPNEKGCHYLAVKKICIIKRNNVKTLW